MSISEIFLFSADRKEELVEGLKQIEKFALTVSDSKIKGLAKFNNEKVDFSKNFKAALIAKDGNDLRFLLEKLAEKITALENKTDDLPIYFSENKTRPKLALLFPPQGCQKVNSGQILIKNFSWAKEISEKIDKELLAKIFTEANSATEEELAKSENAQLAITLSSLLWLEFLKKLGVKADIVAGHSLGELLALYEAKAFTIDELIATTILRGQAMGNTKIIGTMVGLSCNEEMAKKIIGNIKEVQIANINGPNQTVVSGSKDAIKEAIKKAQKSSVDTYDLAVGNAFHSKLMSGAANYFSENFKANKKFTPSSPELFSSINGKKINEEINLKTHLTHQITSPVRFVDLIKEIEKETDFIIEVGPGKILKHLIEKISDKIFCCNVESDVDSFFDFNVTLANLFIRNFPLNLGEIYKNCESLDFSAPKAEVSDNIKEDFFEDLREFAKKNTVELPAISNNYEEEFNIETINYRTDYQWSGLLNGHSKNFLDLAEVIERNAAGTMILLIEDTIIKNQLFENQEKFQINLLNNDQNHFLFSINNDEKQILVITKIFSGIKDDRKVIAIIVNKKNIEENSVTEITDNVKQQVNRICERKLIHITNFSTSSLASDSCLSLYHQWLAVTFNEFIYKINPEFFTDSKQKFTCIESNIKFLSSPAIFDKIEAKLYIENFTENNLEISCDFYSTKNSEGKLAEGRQKIIFGEKIDAESALPAFLMQFIGM